MSLPRVRLHGVAVWSRTGLRLLRIGRPSRCLRIMNFASGKFHASDQADFARAFEDHETPGQWRVKKSDGARLLSAPYVFLERLRDRVFAAATKIPAAIELPPRAVPKSRSWSWWREPIGAGKTNAPIHRTNPNISKIVAAAL